MNQTLADLKQDFPRYTDNELYAIWCHQHGLIPIDSEGKLNLEQWKIHASQDGEFFQEGGFRVSRALYGRALKAQKGKPKPPRQVKKKKELAPIFPDAPAQPPDITFARDYHRAATTIYTILEKRAEVTALLRSLEDLDNRIVADLCDNDPRVAAVLHEARNLAVTSRVAPLEPPAEY